MKLQEIKPGEKITYKGDVTVETDVGEGAEINVTDGMIKINGNVGNNAKIVLSLSEEKRASQSISISGTSSIISIGSIISGSNIKIGKITGGKTIVCDGMVMRSGNKSTYLPLPGTRQVTVSINNQKYIGEKVESIGDDIYVNGVKAAEPSSSAQDSVVPKLIIGGSVMNKVTIMADSDVEVGNNIGQHCVIQCDHGELKARNIGKNTIIKTRNTITASAVGDYCELSSSNNGVTADSIGENVSVDVRDAIDISGNVGNYSRLQSRQYGLNASNLGESVNVSVRDAIKVRNIGANSVINSSNYGLTAHDIKENVHVNVRDQISVNSVGNDSHVTSSNYGIDVTERVGSDAELTGRDEISVGSVGDNTKITSRNNSVKVVHECGNNVSIKARDEIKLKDVGDNSSVTSTNNEVKARNLGQNVTINARDDINIDGICPDNAYLRSSSGKVRKPQQSRAGMFTRSPESDQSSDSAYTYRRRP